MSGKTQEKSDEDSILKCPECGSTRIRETQEGELVCQECGTVLEEELIEEAAGPRAFTPEERQRKERTGSPITYTRADRGMATKIGGGSLREVKPSKRGQYYRLKKWQRRLDESRQRRMKYALGELERLTGVLRLPKSVFEESSRLYEKALEKGVVKGRKIESLVAALVYIVARNQGVPRTLKEISVETGVSERELGKTYRYVARELELRIVPVKPEDFISRFGEELGLPGEVQARARRLITDAREKKLLSGRSPDGIVASAIYLASLLENQEITQQRIAEKVDVTEVTVRKGYRHLAEGLDLEDQLED